MKPHEIFKLAIRILGLILCYHGVMGLPGNAGVAIGGLFASSLTGFLMGVVSALWPLATGYWFIRGAEPLARAAYPDLRND